MAQKVQVLLLDDIDGNEAAETVSFSLDGVAYEIDLNEENARAMRDSIAQWIEHARRSAPRSARPSARRSAAKGDGPSPAELREWARANGYQVSERGRISEQIRGAYAAAR